MAACFNLGTFTIAANASMSLVTAFGGFPQQDAGVVMFMATPKTNGILEVQHQGKQRFGSAPGLIQYPFTVKNNTASALQFTLQAGIVCQP